MVVYKWVMKIENPVLRRILYHLLQTIIGFALGAMCAILTQAIGNRGAFYDTKQIGIISISMAVGWFILSFGWYSHARDFFENQK